MIEKYSCYEFEVLPNTYTDWVVKPETEKSFVYKIYGEGCHPYDDGVINSDEYFDTEQEARFAAIGHIVNLENGE